MCFIDFAWSGKEGAVEYPGWLNPDVPQGGMVSHMPAKREHDKQLLLAYIRE